MDSSSDVLSSCHARRPCPLKVMAAKVSGNIHHLTNKVQVRLVQNRHGF